MLFNDVKIIIKLELNINSIIISLQNLKTYVIVLKNTIKEKNYWKI